MQPINELARVQVLTHREAILEYNKAYRQRERWRMLRNAKKRALAKNRTPEQTAYIERRIQIATQKIMLILNYAAPHSQEKTR